MRTLLNLVVLVMILCGCSAATAPSPTPAPTTTPTPAPIVGDVARGEEIFRKGFNGAPPCSSCHLAADVNFGFTLGPNLTGIGRRAGNRVEGLDAEAYIHQSILDPRSYIVAGYRSIMYPDYGKHLDEQDITDLIAYLMTL
jgi:cytochrome c2